MYEIIKYFFVLGLFFLLIEIIGMVRSIKNYFKEKITFETYKSDMNTSIEDKDYTLLDNIINNTISDYVVENGIIENTYIGEAEENKICSDICTIITDNMSEFIMLKLSKIYNLNKLSDIIASKVYLAVSIYVIETNSNIKK